MSPFFYIILGLIIVILIDLIAINFYDDYIKNKKKWRRDPMFGASGDPYVLAVVIIIVCIALMCVVGFMGIKKYLDALATAANLMP